MTEIASPFTFTNWFKDDPRYHIGKRAKIIIYDDAKNRVRLASVDTKNVYCVFINEWQPDERNLIRESEDWPKGWVWTYLPKK